MKDFTEIPLFPREKKIKIFNSIEAVKKNCHREVTVSELEKIFNTHRKINNFRWTNNPLIHSETIHADIKTIKIKGLPVPHQPGFLKSVPLDWKVNTDSLAICHINNQIGYGVIATQKIPKGRWLLFNGKTKPVDKHEIAYCKNNVYISFITDAENNKFRINAKHAGGFSSLILASVNNDFLQDIKQYAPLDAKRLGVANFKAIAITMNGISQLALVTTKDIWPQEILLGDYGKSYFMQFTGPFIALNKDGSSASPTVTQLINKKLADYVTGRNKSWMPTKKLAVAFENLDKKQLQYRSSDVPRVFLQEDIFIVFSDVYKELLQIAKLALEENCPNLAKSILLFTQLINVKFNGQEKEKSDIAMNIYGLLHTIEQEKVSEVLIR